MDNESLEMFDQFVAGIPDSVIIKTESKLDADELAEALAIQEELSTSSVTETATYPDTQQPEIEVVPVKSEFEMKLEAAKKLLSTRGKYVGLCEHCLGTDKVYGIEDGYSGIRGRMEGENVAYTKCTHGRDITNDYTF